MATAIGIFAAAFVALGIGWHLGASQVRRRAVDDVRELAHLVKKAESQERRDAIASHMRRWTP